MPMQTLSDAMKFDGHLSMLPTRENREKDIEKLHKTKNHLEIKIPEFLDAENSGERTSLLALSSSFFLFPLLMWSFVCLSLGTAPIGSPL